MEARKLNKVYTIDAREAQAWADDGYDIYDRGKLVKRGSGQTVPRADFDNQAVEIVGLKAEVAALKKENASLKGQLTKLKKA